MAEESSERFKDYPASYLRDSYVEVLDRYLPAELRQPGRKSRVISVGCGFALELKGLQQILPDAYIEAIDNAEVTLLGARMYNPEFSPDRIRIGDAIEREALGNEDWDLIVIRNPQVSVIKGRINEAWEKILRNCVDRLKQNSFLYLTTLTSVEMKGILSFLSHFPLEDVTPNDPTGAHKIQPPIAEGFPFTEHYIAVLKKKDVI